MRAEGHDGGLRKLVTAIVRSVVKHALTSPTMSGYVFEVRSTKNGLRIGARNIHGGGPTYFIVNVKEEI